MVKKRSTRKPVTRKRIKELANSAREGVGIETAEPMLAGFEDKSIPEIEALILEVVNAKTAIKRKQESLAKSRDDLYAKMKEHDRTEYKSGGKTATMEESKAVVKIQRTKDK